MKQVLGVHFDVGTPRADLPRVFLPEVGERLNCCWLVSRFYRCFDFRGVFARVMVDLVRSAGHGKVVRMSVDSRFYQDGGCTLVLMGFSWCRLMYLCTRALDTSVWRATVLLNSADAL